MADEPKASLVTALEQALTSAYSEGKKAGFEEGKAAGIALGEQMIEDALKRTTGAATLFQDWDEALDLSERPRNCLKRAQSWWDRPLTTVGDLTDCSADDLLAITNFGQKSVDEVREKLALHGLKLTGD